MNHCDLCGSSRQVKPRTDVELRKGVAGWIAAVCSQCAVRYGVSNTALMAGNQKRRWVEPTVS